MSCPLWGAGALWGDGSLWCRSFGSNKFIADPIDSKVFHRVALEVTITNNSDFIIDRISALVRQQQDIAYTYESFVDLATLTRVSLELSISSDGDFVIQNLIPYIRIKKHDPLG